MKKAKALRAKKEYLNIREMVEDIGEIYKGRVAYRYRVKPHDKEAIKVTYDEMRDHVRAFATEIVARGLQGKKICVIGKHTYQLIQSYYATLAIGSVWVPLDRDWAKEDLLETVAIQSTELPASFMYPGAKVQRIMQFFLRRRFAEAISFSSDRVQQLKI